MEMSLETSLCSLSRLSLVRRLNLHDQLLSDTAPETCMSCEQ